MLLLIALENTFQYANLQKIYKMEYLKTNLNTGRCCSLALARFFHYRKEQKFARYARLSSSLQKKTEKTEKLQKFARWRSLTCFVSRYPYYARWRSPLFFITEKDGKNRKITEICLLALTYLLRQSLSLLCSLALASLLHYRKKQKKQKKTETFACGRLRQR